VPTLLYYDGIFIEEAMQAEAVTKEEIYSIIRSSGIEYLEQVRAVVMELNGQISILRGRIIPIIPRHNCMVFC